MPKKLILITGGCRSGKSQYAIELAKKLHKKTTVYLATMTFKDAEMQERIKAHQQSRPQEWQTVEEGRDIDTVLMNLKGLSEVVLIDCFTSLASNLLLELQEQDKVLGRIESLLKVIADSDLTVIAVTNEVGAGIVPDNKLGRVFRDVAGCVNQLVAQAADEVYLMVAGIPVKIK
ncbi:MAG: bifunctional adenosylcobinamide kinase/adenosylcobinamide-phosphate guanylyltransferase [Planctomycetota bacterium]|nr:bifunctional adenosylcobinamide kinase/adenosylcobinamide-phosphate guanylyltransferase [Planctomycetota bacterium]MDI6787043.1 bifunctional adenosylcobinamide kinase/adenosylcobinamide-phosphate guanylyltransferase [Planctomycetota bacterium]